MINWELGRVFKSWTRRFFCKWRTTFFSPVVVCQELELLVNGNIQYSPYVMAPYLEGTNAEHICVPGFILIGNVIRVCQSDSTFSGVPPTCQRKLYLTIMNLPLFLNKHSTCKFWQSFVCCSHSMSSPRRNWKWIHHTCFWRNSKLWSERCGHLCVQRWVRSGLLPRGNWEKNLCGWFG